VGALIVGVRKPDRGRGRSREFLIDWSRSTRPMSKRVLSVSLKGPIWCRQAGMAVMLTFGKGPDRAHRLGGRTGRWHSRQRPTPRLSVVVFV
jgi:hypothetical protein